MNIRQTSIDCYKQIKSEGLLSKRRLEVYERKLYELFIKEYKGKARQKYVECYHLLKLRTE